MIPYMRRVLEPQRVGVCRATRLPLVPAPVRPKLWSVSSLASSAIGASSPPSDGLSQRGILLVHGVRARRGGVAREKAKARGSIRTHKSVARTASSAAEQLHYTRPKKDSVCSEDIQKWVYWWASNYASPGLTVLGSRRPGPPAPAQAGTRGAKRST